MYTDDDGMEFFATGETMDESFENLYRVYEDTGPGQADLDPEDGSLEFFERIAVQYVTRPRFERV
jgi:hypothetical protein